MQTPISQHNQKPKPVTHPDFHIPVLVNRARVISTTTCLASDIFYLTKGLDNGRISVNIERHWVCRFQYLPGMNHRLCPSRGGCSPQCENSCGGSVEGLCFKVPFTPKFTGFFTPQETERTPTALCLLY